uniref:MHC class I-like antigen recognition-like domain-containing protein n=1 Tax=Naja naja TaxID=35670 RepID=A0A8C6XYK9_NAJNA
LLPPPPRSLLLSSFQYFSTAISDYYDSNSQRVQPRVSWMEKVEKDDPQYRDRNTRNFCGDEELFRGDLEVLRSRYNQSEGLHTWQQMYGCELQANRSKGGFMQYGYEGRTFITFDKETLTWVAPDPQAQISQRRWDALPAHNQFLKSYLEEICLDWIRKYLSYGKEMLLRTGENAPSPQRASCSHCNISPLFLSCTILLLLARQAPLWAP